MHTEERQGRRPDRSGCGARVSAPVIIVLLAALGGCRGDRGTPPPVPAPRVRFEPARLELGRGDQDEELRGAVTVRNVGTAPLVIGRIESSRFCAGRIGVETIAPGVATDLAVTCRSDLHGPLREGIDLRPTDPSLAVATLQIRAEITPRLAFDVPAVDLSMPFGEERSLEVHLVGRLAERSRPRLIEAAGADSDISPIPPAPGRGPGYRIRCRGRKVGSNGGNLVVATGLDQPAEVAIPYVCKVQGTLEVSPSNPFFNLKVSGDKAVRLSVRSSQPGFEVQAVRVTSGPFAARFEHAEDDGTYRVDVAVLNERIADETRALTGTLLIVSNDRTEPRKEVPLFGSGRINKVAVP
jgi:hypothetical protein